VFSVFIIFRVKMAADFYKLIESESSTVKFLQTHGLLPDDINPQKCSKYDAVTKMCWRKKYLANEEVWEYKVRTERLSNIWHFNQWGKIMYFLLLPI